MQTESVLERIEKDLESLSPQEQLELVERLISKLRKRHILVKEYADWADLHGLGKGLWKEDAQEYVDRLRKDRT